jgi:hypothetical protein
LYVDGTPSLITVERLRIESSFSGLPISKAT